MIIDELFESPQQCPECGGISFSDLILAEKKDACYHKVKASAKVWPSAYASGRLVQCRKKGAANYGNKSEGVAEGQLDELDMFAPVTTYVRLANGTYVAANWRRNQNLSTASNSASFIDIKPLAPNVAKQLGLDQRLNDPEKKYTGATTIASGGPIQASGPFADKTINVVDIRDPKAAKDSGVPDLLFGKIAQWAQQQGQKQPGVAEAELDEKSVSQAQFRTMAGAAHNPEFARKVGISQDVAKEFNQADKKSNYKKLPDRATEGEQQPGADYRDPKEVDYDDEYDDMVARVKRLAGLGPMKTTYDPAKRQYRNMPTAVQPKK
jgi:hypothetical protein